MKGVRALAAIAALLAIWLAAIYLGGAEHFILPKPWAVAGALVDNAGLLAGHALSTAIEILFGMIVGCALGIGFALALAYHAPTRAWLLPALVISQAIPVFAIAPLLVLWLGYGLASKIAMAALVIFFPVAVALHDGMARIEPGWIDLARTMGATRAAILRHIRLPAALPALATGLRLAASVAPIAAIIGEWVGASSGLGYLMMQGLARGKTDLAFAALVLLAAMAIGLYRLVDAGARRSLRWHGSNIDSQNSNIERISP